MGYDVTHHPVSAKELQHFVFDVLDNPSLLGARMAELTDDEEIRDAVRGNFEDTLVAIDREAAGVDAGEPEDDDDDADLAEPADRVRFLSAIVAGCRHPYWVNRGAALSFARDSVPVAQDFQPLGTIGTGRIQTIPDYNGANGFIGNWSATGFMLPADVSALLKTLPTDTALKGALGDWGTKSLTSALRYAETRGLGLIEATDVWSVAEQYSDPRNLRGVEGTSTRTPPRPTSPEPEAVIECPACGVANIPGTKMCECGRDLRSTAADVPPNRNGQALLIIGLAVAGLIARIVFGELRAADFVLGSILVGRGIFLLRR